MIIFLNKLTKPFKRFYPYDNSSIFAKIRTIIQCILIKVLDKYAYSKISLVSYLKKENKFKTDNQFLEKYNESKNGFEELWNSKERLTQEQIESFYSEHDKDVWRQVYLSKFSRHRKKCVLMAYNVLRDYSKDSQVKILDYGCGCGNYSNYFYKKGYKNICLADIRSSTFDFMKKTFGSKFKYISIDGAEPLSDNYDVVLMLDCLAHAYNPYNSVKHVIDHIETGGLIIMYYEKGVDNTHLARAHEQREKTMDYIKSKCKCLKDEEVYIKL